MTASVLNTGIDNDVAATSFTFTYGFSPTEGNLLIACVTKNNDTDEPAAIVDDSSTWTELFQSKHDSAVTAVFWKVAAASEPTFEGFTHTDSGKWAAGILEITDQHVTPINASDFSFTDSVSKTAVPISPDILTTVTDTLIVAGFGNNNFLTHGLDAALTTRWDETTTSSGAVGTAGGSVAQAAADQTGTFSHSLSSSAGWMAFTIAIAPSTGNTTLNATAGAVTITGGSATPSAPTLSEVPTLWFNGEWWKDPFWGTTWWTISTDVTLSAEFGTVVVTGGSATLTETGDDITLTVQLGAVTVTGGEGKLSIPLVVSLGAVTITGGAATLQVEFTSEEFIISNSTTFDGKGIIYGSDICYNSSTDLGYTVVARVDVDSIFLSGIFGAAPQPYQIHKKVGEITNKSVTIVEFNNGEWRIVSTTNLGL